MMNAKVEKSEGCAGFTLTMTPVRGMSVYELNRDQMLHLKQAMLCERIEEGTSYGALAMADELISDWEVYDEYDGTVFTEDDFWN